MDKDEYLRQLPELFRLYVEGQRRCFIGMQRIDEIQYPKDIPSDKHKLIHKSVTACIHLCDRILQKMDGDTEWKIIPRLEEELDKQYAEYVNLQKSMGFKP